jgi:mevalonate-3-phosphate-5-kinase
MNRVPIILIGGIPGVGKTSISGYIARQLNINIVMSGDYIREIIRPFVPDDDVLQYSVYDSWKKYGENTEVNVTRGFLNQGKLINRATYSSIRRAINNGEPMIIETLYFIPDQLKEIIGEITSLYIHISDYYTHVNRLNEREKYTHFGSPGERLSSNLKNYRIVMKESMRQCEKYNIRIFDNMDYIRTREQILEYVSSVNGRI